MLRFKELILEDIAHEQNVQRHVDDFMQHAKEYLKLDQLPQVRLINSKKLAQDNASFGGYYPGEKKIEVNIAGRHPVDILRTLGHELVHYRQDLNGKLEDVAMAGETGSTFENEANSEAGIMMRNYGRSKPQIYESYRK
ncbi:hypothetical protein OAU13_00535 [bacterium]|nr:hypothetical protein [bacterium]